MKTLLVVALMCAPFTVQAQSPCRAVQDNLRRLACYDSLAAGPAEQKPSPTSSESGGWTVREKKDPMTDKINVSGILESTNYVGRLGKSATLIIRCSNGELDAYVSWNAYLSDMRRVNFRIDGGEIESKTWSSSTDKDALFATGDVAAWIGRLASAKSLAIQTVPYSSGPSTAEFDLTGSAGPVKQVLAACSK